MSRAETHKKILCKKNVKKTLDFSAHIVYNNKRRPERAIEQKLSNMRP